MARNEKRRILAKKRKRLQRLQQSKTAVLDEPQLERRADEFLTKCRESVKSIADYCDRCLAPFESLHACEGCWQQRESDFFSEMRDVEEEWQERMDDEVRRLNEWWQQRWIDREMEFERRWVQVTNCPIGYQQLVRNIEWRPRRPVDYTE